MPDDQDHADLAELLSRPEQWSEAEADRARLFRKYQAAAAGDYDQRDKARVAAMLEVIQQLDEALAVWEAAR